MSTREFSPLLNELVEWVHGDRMGDHDIDFEMYQAINEQYKPSDWCPNPALDDRFSTFGMDGSGGQVALWHRGPGDEPVVMLGSEGEIAVFARDLAGFLHQLAHGADPRAMLFDGLQHDGDVITDMAAWVRGHFPARELASPSEEHRAAQHLLPELEAFLASHDPSRAPAAEKPSAKKTSAKKTSAKKTSTKKTSAKKPSAKKPSAKKTSAKKTSAKKPSAKKPSAKKPSAKKTSAKKPSAKKPSAKKTSAKKPSAKKPVAARQKSS